MHSDPNVDQLAFDVDSVPTPSGSSTPSVSTVTEPSTPPSSSANALDALLNEYRARATSEREKGTLFEELTRQFLLHDARFAHQFKEVYLWGEWPERRTADTGIDLVAIPNQQDAGPVAIQCKFYAPGHKVSKADIDTFLSASGKEPFARRIVVDTSGTDWGKNAQDAIEGQQIPVSRITLADLRDSDIDWRTYSLGSMQAPKTRERKVPRDHQVRARSAVIEGFTKHGRGTMVMACGTGKTFTALTIAREFMEKEGGTARILFTVPSLALLKQTLDDWAAEADGAFTAWAVCSDTKVSSAARNDTVADSPVDLPIPATTDAQRLAHSLCANNITEGLQVVFATYQSIDVIHDAQEIAGDEWRDFDLVICDEAHRTTGATLTGEDESAFTKIHSDEFIRRSKTLYMTATPRIFAENAKNKASEKDAILTSMDDQDTYGPVFFRLGFGQAVKEGLLTDYKVIILTVSEDEVSKHYQAIAEMGGELNLDTAAKLTGCWNALAKRKNPGSNVDYGEDRAPMRRLGLTGLNTHPRPARRGGRGPVAHEDHCARQWDQGALDRVWITDFTYLRCAQGWVYLCAVRDAHSRQVLGYAMGEQQSTDLVISALDMAATTRGGFPRGVVLHADRGTQFTSRNWPPTSSPPKEPCRWARSECAGITPWPNPCGPPSKPSTTTGVPSPPATRSTPGSPPGSKTSTTAAASTPASAANPPSNTNYTKRPGQQPHKQTVNNLRTGPS